MAHGQATEGQSASRRGRPGYDLESLLAVAVAVFNERGYDGTSMEDLSRRLGISKSSIYYHVDSKEDLLALALDRALDGLFSVADEVKASGEPAIVRLERLVRGSVQVLADRLPYVTLLLRARGNTSTEREALVRRREFDQIVADLVARGRAGRRHPARRRPGDHGSAAVRHGQLPRRVVPAGPARHVGGRAGRRRLRSRVRRPPDPPDRGHSAGCELGTAIG